MEDKKLEGKLSHAIKYIELNSWINVKDRKPKGICLVYLSKKHLGKRIHTASYHKNLVEVGGGFDFDLDGVVTHWQTLPEPPENK